MALTATAASSPLGQQKRVVLENKENNKIKKEKEQKHTEMS